MAKYIVTFLILLFTTLAQANQIAWVIDNARVSNDEAKRYVLQVQDASLYYGVDSRIVLALIKEESTFNSKAKGCSPTDPCVGLMQIKPALHAGKGRFKTLPLTNPKRNIDVGVYLIKHSLDLCAGNYNCALQDYNRSPRKKRYARKIMTAALKVPYI